MSRRDRLSNTMATFGLTRLLEVMARHSGLIVLNYHRIGRADTCDYDRGVFEASAEQFDQQIAFLKRTYDLVDLEEVREYAERRTLPRRPKVLVTFDDGYRDTYDVALPVLKHHRVRAAFFLPTAFVGTNRVPWWDQIAYAVRHARKRFLHLSYPESFVLDRAALGTEGTIRRLLRVYKQPQVRDVNRFLRSIEEACDLEMPSTSSERLFLSWSEAQALAAAGMAIGSHTHRHEPLSRLSETEQREECAMSRAVLAEQLGVSATALSFPIGSPESFNSVTQECLRATGYTLAFSYYGGVNSRHLDPMNVRRIVMGPMPLSQYRLRTAVAATLGKQLW